jgi:hypothetical protein
MAAPEGGTIPRRHPLLRAAEELERLAAEIDGLNGSEIEHQISTAHDALDEFDDENCGSSAWLDIDEIVSAELRGVGFHLGYATATEFLEWYRDLLRQKRDEQIEEALSEQVEEDPGVKGGSCP